MKRLVAVIAGGLGIGAFLRRRHRASARSEGAPADELRAKLAEARSADEQPEAVVEEQTVEEPDLNGRRSDVHERARRAIDELRD